MNKVVVMGGSFNPPTIAHQKMLIYVVEQLGADKGVFVPSPYDYVYAKMEQKGMPEEALSDELRLAMLRAMCEDDAGKNFEDINYSAMKADYNKYATPNMFPVLLYNATTSFNRDKKCIRGTCYRICDNNGRTHKVSSETFDNPNIDFSKRNFETIIKEKDR